MKRFDTSWIVKFVKCFFVSINIYVVFSACMGYFRVCRTYRTQYRNRWEIIKPLR
nr:MAG TPA: hypothetical protein [Caudoviricetes sp.]